MLQSDHGSGEDAVVVAEDVAQGPYQDGGYDEAVPSFGDGHGCGCGRSADVGVGRDDDLLQAEAKKLSEYLESIGLFN